MYQSIFKITTTTIIRIELFFSVHTPA